MLSKEEYYESVLQNRKLVADPEATKCTCPNTLCDWHGKCKECVVLHRHYNDHIPVCLQLLVRDKLKALAGVCELVATKKEDTPIEYRRYVKQRDNENSGE